MERYKKQKRKRKTQQQLVILVAVIAIIALIGYGLVSFFRGCPDGIPELGSGNLAVHIHVHLDVFVNASPVTVPDTLGDVSGTFCALHTHDATGVIHVESPDTRPYTVQEIFDVWGYVVPSSALVYVNGQLDSLSHVLVAHDEIAVVIGTPPTTIPSSFNFPPGS